MSARRVDLGAPPPELAGAAELAAAVEAARLVCFPTETVYAVGGSLRPATIAALVGAKGRAPGKPLQVIFPSLDVLAATVAFAPRVGGAVRRLLPGPVTLVVPYPAGWSCPPPGDVDGRPTLGVRVPDWPRRARLLAQLRAPLIASSANLSGAADPRSLAAVDPVVLAACDLILDGGEVDGRASTVVDLTLYEESGAWRLLREGLWGAVEVAARLSDT